MYFQYNYKKGFLLCYEQNAGDFQFLFSGQRGGVEKAQVFPTAQGVNFIRKKALFKEQGMMKDKPEDGE